MKTVNLAVIGCGVIGPQHMESAKETEGVHLAALADVDESRVKAMAERFGVELTYTDPIALLDNPDIDGVVLALPAGFRADLAAEALRRGKHIMLEKPAARTVAELDTILKEAGDLVVASASARYRLMPHVETVQNFIASGKLGEIRSLHGRNLLPPGPPPAAPPPAWRVSRDLNGGGVLVNISSYEVDYLLGFLDYKVAPLTIMAHCWPIGPLFGKYVDPKSDAEEHFAAFIRCENNIALYLERGERVARPASAAMEIIGSNGSLILDMLPNDNKVITWYSYDENGNQTEEVIWSGAETWQDTRRGIIRDFAAAIREGRPAITCGQRMRVVQQVMNGIYLSSDEQRPVSVEEI